MTNPNGAVAGNAQNIPEAHTPRTRSTFDLKYHFFNTHRFGEYIPHYVEDVNKDEDLPINSSSQIRSYTLDSPLMQNVKRNKDYFLVPMEAILPLNWEKFFDNPVRGDDVLDDVGPSVQNFWTKVATFMTSLQSALNPILTANDSGSGSVAAKDKLQAFFRFLILGEYFYSNGNLLASLGCHGAQYVWAYGIDPAITGVSAIDNRVTFDTVFDECVQFIEDRLTGVPGSRCPGCFVLNVDGYTYTVDGRAHVQFNRNSISLRHALQLMRDNPTFTITSANPRSGLSGPLPGEAYPWDDLKDSFWDLLWPYNEPGSGRVSRMAFLNGNYPVDLSRLWAYQLCCAHYMSNDHIDFIYSADLYRQLVGNYLVTWNNGQLSAAGFFIRNGVKYQYDYLSAHFFTWFFSAIAGGPYYSNILTGSSSGVNSFLGYLSAIFGYRRSLRYLDYFTGSRTAPLAVVTSGISTNVSVSNSQVSVLDITKSIAAQRFLNSVNRVRHNFEGYLKGIFGGEVPAPDYHNPFYLAHTDDVVYGQETENTGAAQMSDRIAVTTNLRGHSSNYIFQCHTDRPGIVIGLTSYDIPRVYDKTVERAFFKANRFDYFNPFMQYNGDQPIYRQELGIDRYGADLSTLTNFSYTLRDMQYKQRFNQCSGGFCDPSTDLDNWIFVAKDLRGDQITLNPDWIRSLNVEFDQFYVSLTGWSLGTYFHFIVDDFNTCKASRPMAYAPQILG